MCFSAWNQVSNVWKAKILVANMALNILRSDFINTVIAIQASNLRTFFDVKGVPKNLVDLHNLSSVDISCAAKCWIG